MKTTLIISILAFFAFTANAQGMLDVGLKAGINSSKLSANTSDYNNPEAINNYLVGAFARINFGRIYLQPEAYYNSKGGKIDKVSLSTVNEFNLKAVDVPVLVGIKIINQKALNLRVMAGPVFSFVTDKSVSSQLTKTAINDNFFGWQYGAGVDFMFLTLDVRHENFSKDLYTTPDFSSKNGIFLISLGLKLF